jgi:hypothetical protein
VPCSSLCMTKLPKLWPFTVVLQRFLPLWRRSILQCTCRRVPLGRVLLCNFTYCLSYDVICLSTHMFRNMDFTIHFTLRRYLEIGVSPLLNLDQALTRNVLSFLAPRDSCVIRKYAATLGGRLSRASGKHSMRAFKEKAAPRIPRF